MHLQTINRDQPGETLPRQRGEEAEETGLFFFSFFFFCRDIVNILLSCLPTPAFYIAKLWRVFKCKGGVLSPLPKCIPIPKHSVSVSSFPLPLSLSSPLSPHTSWFSISHRFTRWYHCLYVPFFRTHLCTHNFLVLTLFQKGFKASGSTFPVFHANVHMEDTASSSDSFCTLKQQTDLVMYSCLTSMEPTHIRDICTCMQRESETSPVACF